MQTPVDIARRPTLNMPRQNMPTRYLFQKKYRFSLSTKEEWVNGNAKLLNDGDNWFKNGSRNKETAGAGVYR